ncbi:MAG: Nif3-like dinuclear metal center hexameric protein [Planctomycetota bacterium]
MTFPLAQVVRVIEELAPPELAEDWDSVGLLVEPPGSSPVENLLLTVDLTEAVVEEAVAKKVRFVLAYHPPIFGGLPRLTMAAPMQRAILRAVLARIAVHSPHTSLDACAGGVNDWLAEGLGKAEVTALVPRVVPGAEGPADPRVGQGRRARLARPQSAERVVERIKKHLGLRKVRVALADRHAAGEDVAEVLLCAGAGGAVLAGHGGDLLWTGEMRHHEVLEHREAGRTVVLCEHSNTERGFLPRLRDLLLERFSDKLRVFVSESDRDPLAIR